MSFTIQIKMNNKLFLRNPEESELGKKIVTHSIRLIEKEGMESFTFKKLAREINSVETSVYRYFENKHKLLIYLISLYWAWLEYRIDFQTHNLNNPEKELKIIIQIIAESHSKEYQIGNINQDLLHKIVLAESSKTYLTKMVDDENKEGLFVNYKSLCHKIASVILRFNPNYKYPQSLSSSLIEIAHGQSFFARHLPSLTNFKIRDNNYTDISKYLEHMIFLMVKP
jgi:AcrR family transcriptional regulator